MMETRSDRDDLRRRFVSLVVEKVPRSSQVLRHNVEGALRMLDDALASPHGSRARAFSKEMQFILPRIYMPTTAEATEAQLKRQRLPKRYRTAYLLARKANAERAGVAAADGISPADVAEAVGRQEVAALLEPDSRAVRIRKNQRQRRAAARDRAAGGGASASGAGGRGSSGRSGNGQAGGGSKLSPADLQKLKDLAAKGGYTFTKK